MSEEAECSVCFMCSWSSPRWSQKIKCPSRTLRQNKERSYIKSLYLFVHIREKAYQFRPHGILIRILKCWENLDTLKTYFINQALTVSGSTQFSVKVKTVISHDRFLYFSVFLCALLHRAGLRWEMMLWWCYLLTSQDGQTFESESDNSWWVVSQIWLLNSV